MGLELLPVPGIPDINPGDDIVAIIGDALAPLGLVDGDILTLGAQDFLKG